MAKINLKNRTVPQRVDPEFLREMKELAKQRFFQGLAKELPSFSEMTRLTRRSPYWPNIIFDLKTKPKKEDIK